MWSAGTARGVPGELYQVRRALNLDPEFTVDRTGVFPGRHPFLGDAGRAE